MASKGYALMDDSNQILNGSALPVPSVLSSTSGISGTSTGTTNLYTVPTGKTAIITDVVVRITAAATVSIVALAGVGIAAGEDDIFAAQSLVGLNAVGKHFQFVALGTKVSANSGEVVKFGIDTAYIAGTATLAVDLIGYLL